MLAGAALSTTAVSASAPQPVTSTRETVAQAIVEDVDRLDRSVSFRTPEGLLSEVHVPPELGSLDDLQHGDRVTVRFIESVVVRIDPAARPTLPEDTTAEAQARETSRDPHVVQQLTVTVTIDSVDAQTGTVVYHKADNMKILRAVADRRLLDGLKAGDRVVITYTKARAVSVERAR